MKSSSICKLFTDSHYDFAVVEFEILRYGDVEEEGLSSPILKRQPERP